MFAPLCHLKIMGRGRGGALFAGKSLFSTGKSLIFQVNGNTGSAVSNGPVTDLCTFEGISIFTDSKFTFGGLKATP